MAIYNYSTNSHHAGGATGIRVVVTVGSDTHQHYFTQDEESKAEKCNSDLLKRREAYNRKKERTREPNPSMGYSYTLTGVKGIRMNVKMCRGRTGKPYYRCILAVSVTSTVTNKKVHKTFIVTGDNLQSQWYAACLLLAQSKGRLSPLKKWVEECPTSVKFTQVITGYMDNYLLLDIGFKSLPKSKYPVTRSNVVKGY